MSWERHSQPIRDAVSRGDLALALDRFAELLDAEASPRVYKLGARLADAAAGSDAARTVRLRVLRSYTAEPLIEAVRARALADRLAVEVELGGYGQIERSLLIPTPPATDTDAVLITARLTDLLPDFGRGFAALSAARAAELADEVVQRVGGWLSALRDRDPGASRILCGFALPATPAYGLADPSVELGHRRAIAAINDRIAGAVGAAPGAVFVDVDAVLSEVGYRAALDPRMNAHAQQPLSAAGIDALSTRIARVLGAGFAPRRKCLVLDCDDTLWGGVIGEDGIDGIALGPDYPGSAYVELQRAVLDLGSRGVILALASKNNPADVFEVLEHHPHQVLRREHFAAARIGWGDKATALREIAAELDVGTDSLVLLDDSDFECALVRAELPEVLVVRAPDQPLELAPLIDRLRCFDALAISDADRSRGSMYRARARRSQAHHEAPSLEGFLESLELVLTIEPTSRGQVARAAQLTARTNQLNATTRRYTAAEIEQLVGADDAEVWCVRLADRFGDYGICGLAITRRAEHAIEIDTLLLSCRVIGRGVEDAVVGFVERRARAAGATELVGRYLPTAKNAPVADLFDRLGFRRAAETDGAVEYRRDLESVRPYPRWFTIKAP